VSKDILNKKVKMYMPIIPAYFGWFLCVNDSEKLLSGSKKLLQSCLKRCDKFRSDFGELLLSLESRPHRLEYFKYPNAKKSNQHLSLHCTAKYCGKPKNGRYSQNILTYASDPKVVESVGMLSKLNIIGFVITKKTFGARVKLSKSQLALYDQRDAHISSLCSTQHEKRAHITLGVAENVYPVQTGYDHLKAFELESSEYTNNLNDESYTYQIPTTKLVLKRFRKELWVVDTSGNKLDFNAIFSAHYM
jgi:2',3'-cyclic-nucleotide 3'-phosphodiesterase